MECVRPERPRPVAASSRAQVGDHSISPRAHEVAGLVTSEPGFGKTPWVIAIHLRKGPAAESGWHRNGLIPPAGPSAAVRMAAQLSEEPSSLPPAQHSRPFLPGHCHVMDTDASAARAAIRRGAAGRR
jgi:hypothetical protein